MPEVRERKNSDKIKGKSNKKSGPLKKDLRRQMTAKYVKELTQRQKNRDAGGSTAQAPEVQAVEQVEETIYTTADSLRDRTADAVSKSISRHKQEPAGVDGDDDGGRNGEHVGALGSEGQA